MNYLGSIKTHFGVEWWMAPHRTGPVAPDRNGRPRRAPRMTVIDSVGVATFRAALISLATSSYHFAFMAAWLIDDPDLLQEPAAILSSLVIAAGFLASLYLVMVGIRWEEFIPLIGSASVHGIHFDWGKPAAASVVADETVDAAPPAKPDAAPADFEFRLPDDDDADEAA